MRVYEVSPDFACDQAVDGLVGPLRMGGKAILERCLIYSLFPMYREDQEAFVGNHLAGYRESVRGQAWGVASPRLSSLCIGEAKRGRLWGNAKREMLRAGHRPLASANTDEVEVSRVALDIATSLYSYTGRSGMTGLFAYSRLLPSTLCTTVNPSLPTLSSFVLPHLVNLAVVDLPKSSTPSPTT
jgi:hypothetical protein